jgi:hypothetical protein
MIRKREEVREVFARNGHFADLFSQSPQAAKKA